MDDNRISLGVAIAIAVTAALVFVPASPAVGPLVSHESNSPGCRQLDPCNLSVQCKGPGPCSKCSDGLRDEESCILLSLVGDDCWWWYDSSGCGVREDGRCIEGPPGVWKCKTTDPLPGQTAETCGAYRCSLTEPTCP